MKKKAAHGGARKSAGRKPLDDKKVQVNLYVEQSVIDKHGGKEKVQEKCYRLLRGAKK